MRISATGSAARTVLTFLLYLALTLGLQVANHAYSSDIADFDETGHYVTGLMVYSWLMSGEWLDPMGFAHRYYDAYPRVSMGHWPPLFHFLQAGWMLVCTNGRVSVMLLMACLAAASAGVLYAFVRRETGDLTAFLAGAWLLCIHITQWCTSLVMAEIPLLLLVCCALAVYAQYLQSEEPRYSYLFGAAAAAALMTKANALALVFVPLLSVIFSGKTRLLKRIDFWAPAVIAGGICAPWYIATFSMAAEGYQTARTPSARYLSSVLSFNIGVIRQETGILIMIAAAAGVLLTVLVPLAGRVAVRPVWSVAAAAGLGWFVFHTLIMPVRETRHMLPFIAIMILFAGAAITRGADALARTRLLSRRAGFATIWLGCIAVFSVEAFRLAPKPAYGAVETAAILDGSSGNVLVVSPDARGEGALIAEVALRHPRPKRRLLRGSKVLATTEWDNRNYTALVNTEAEARERLKELGVTTVVIFRDGSAGSDFAHYGLIARMMDVTPGDFSLVSVARGKYYIYERNGGRHPG